MQVDDPLLFGAIIAVLAMLLLTRQLLRWRRARALEARATSAGWQPIGGEDAEQLADLVRTAFPELGEEAAGDARRGGVRPRGRAGSTIRLGKPRTKVGGRARNVHVLPVEGGTAVAGDVKVTAARGAAGQDRAAVHRGAVGAQLAASLPDLTLTARDWIDHGEVIDLPTAMSERFSAARLSDDARRLYLDAGAYEPLTAAPDELQGVAVTGDTLVLLSASELTPEAAEALAATADRFAARALEAADAAPAGAGSTPTTPSRLRSPIATG